jgi:hypothetical protein
MITSYDRSALAHLLRAAAIVHRADAVAPGHDQAHRADALASASQLESLARLAERAKPTTLHLAMAQLGHSERAWLQRYLPLATLLLNRTSTSLTYAGER